MKRSRGMSSITSIIKSSLRHMTLSLRRFKKRGGIGGFFGRLLLNLKKGRRSTVMGCAAFGLALVLLVCLPLIGGGRKEKALPTPVTEASAASAEGIVDLQGEFAALQQSLAAAEPHPPPPPAAAQEELAEAKNAIRQLGTGAAHGPELHGQRRAHHPFRPRHPGGHRAFPAAARPYHRRHNHKRGVRSAVFR